MSAKVKVPAGEKPARLHWRRIVAAAVRLDLAVAAFLVLQWALFGTRTEGVVWPEVLGLSFLFSWRFVLREVPSRFVTLGALLGVMAIVFGLDLL